MERTGDFPCNSKGETYGRHSLLDNYVGYAPDLEYVLSRAEDNAPLEGYIDPAELHAVPTDLPADECPHIFSIPLYDSEHRVIGDYKVSCGGHIPSGITVEEAKALTALQMENESWQSAEEIQEYLSRHWDEENKEEIP